MGIFRVLLAIAVIIGHSTPLFGLSFMGSAIAVQAFFIISGFYMSMILNEKYIQHKGYYKLFISNRFLKIFPGYWLVLLLTIFFSICSYFTTGKSLRLDFYFQNHNILNIFDWIYFITINLGIFFQETVLYMGINPNNGIFYLTENFRNTTPLLFKSLMVPQAWTLSFELLFYLIAPFILIQTKYKYRVWIIFILSLCLFITLNTMGINYDPWIRRFFPAQLFLFLAGYISYLVYKNIKLEKIWNIIIFAFILLISIFYDKLGDFLFKNYLYLTSVMLAIPFIFELTKKSFADKRIGNLSYIIYILHLLVINLLGIVSSSLLYKNYYSFIIIVVTILCSALIDVLILDKIEQVRQKRISNAG